MNITELTSSGQQTRTIQHPYLFLSVVTWELRRFYASRLFWLQAFGFFCFLLFVTWAQGMTNQINLRFNGESVSGFVAGTSAWGLVQNLPSISLVLLVLLLPFVTTDGVTRDLQRRTHELLMTTALPTRTYVWGRYVVCLLLSLGLAVLLLAAILGMGVLMHLTIAEYPLPQIAALLLLWVGMVLPATILVSSLSFSLGTLFSRLTNVVKIVIIFGWIVGAIILPIGLHNSIPTWYINWDPTSAVTGLGIAHQYSFSNMITRPTSAAQFQQALLAIENKMPDIGSWFVSHLLLAAISLVLVLVASLAFKRSRDTLN